MDLLLDTHTFVWFVTGDTQLSKPAETLLRDPANALVFSVAGVWEMAIKSSVGKLTLSQPLDVLVPQGLQLYNITLVPIELRHLFRVAVLPRHHRDPFDRLIASQSLCPSGKSA